MEKNDSIFWLKQIKDKYIHGGDEEFDHLRREAIDYAIKTLENLSWIPVKTKELTDKEIEELIEKNEHMYSKDEIEKWCYCCPLPQNDQDVFITAKSGNVAYVTKVTFYADDFYGCYFEGYEDRDDVLAWMPLPQPQPYTKEETT